MTATVTDDDIRDTPPAEVADAAAVATEAAADSAMPRAGESTDAGARPRVRGRARARVRGRARELGTHVNAALSRDASHGAPWEERPMSLVGLRESIRSRAAFHAALPLGQGLYLTWGYGFIFPVTIAAYTIIWVLQVPWRTFTALALAAILHRLHLMPALPFIQSTPVIRSIF